MRQELAEKTQSMTKLIVAQQGISTIMDADLILVLDQGKSVGQGTHKGTSSYQMKFTKKLPIHNYRRRNWNMENKKMSLWETVRPFLAGLQLPY